MRKHTIAPLALLLALTATVLQPASAAVPTDTAALREAVDAERVLDHLQSFQTIADNNGDTRASGTPGYGASADYVATLLEDAGYAVTRQQFTFPFFEVLSAAFSRVSPQPVPYEQADDYFVMEYSGSGDVEALIQPTNDIVLPPGADANTSTSGCEASDFDGFTPGNIALIQRGTCSFRLKAENAEAAGAVGAIIFNEGQAGRTGAINGTLGGEGIEIPVVGTTFAVGEELFNLDKNDDVRVALDVQTRAETLTTENVIADTTTGRTDRVVVVGAHLDSVPEGPGINDNGSGSATILEVALQMADLGIEPTNQVRFAFWGAEESGLLGAEHYVASLTKAERKDIMLNLNFDMVGSANYVRFVYDGDGSATDIAGPNGSGRIEDVFNDYFASQNLASTPTEFSGRSDYGPFIDVGIPAGGLFTGAEGEKTQEQAEVYGGVAGASYDPCYHQACDTLRQDFSEDSEKAALYEELAQDYELVGNINLDAIDEMSDAAAHAILTFAETTSSVNGTARGSENAKASGLEFKGEHRQR